MNMEYKYGCITFLFTLVMLNFTKGIPCGDPGKIPHGSTKYLKNGMLVQFFCDPGYATLGPPMLSCLRGKWKGKLPTCVAPGCPYVLQPFNAFKTEQMNGAVVTFRCRAGFRMNGESMIYCDGSKWSAAFPTCENQNPSRDVIEPPPRIPRVKEVASPNTTHRNIVSTDDQPAYESTNQFQNSNNGFGRPIFVSSSDKAPIFHKGMMKNIGAGGVLSLYKGGDSEDDDNEGARDRGTSSLPSREMVMPPAETQENGRPIVPRKNGGLFVSQDVRQFQPQEESRLFPSQENTRQTVSQEESRVFVPQGNTRQNVPQENQPGGPVMSRGNTRSDQMRQQYNLYPNPYMLPRQSTGLYNSYQNMYNPYGRRAMPPSGQPSRYQQNPYGFPQYYSQQYTPIHTGTAMRPIHLQPEEQIPNQWSRPRVQQPQTPIDTGSQSFGGRNSGNPDSVVDRTKAAADGNVVRSVPQLVQNRDKFSSFPSKEDAVIAESLPKYETKEVNDYGVQRSRLVVPGIAQVASPLEEKESSSQTGHQRSCPPAPRPINGYYTTRPLPKDHDSDKHLYLIEYRCNAGLNIIGSNVSYCMTNGAWSAKRPRCEQIHTCEPGYTMQRNRRCVDVDECVRKNGGCPQTCQNYPGGFICRCDSGYRQSQDACIDIDECDTSEDQLCNHHCHNSIGSFSCTCRDGYSLMEHDNRTCLDINECLASSPCQHLCQNTFGSFRCACRRNYRLNDDGRTCSEICMPGYKMQLVEETNVKSCVDEDECLEHGGLGSCEQVCTNTAGSYLCSCSTGYKLNEDKQTCSDLDECENEDVPSCEYGCINTVGSFECSCPEDQVLSEDKLLCVGCVNDLYMKNGECIHCPEYAVTENSGATSLEECVCTAGYGGSPELGIPCTDVNECDDDNYGCSHECINTHGSVFCRCPDGFKLLPDGRKCQDVDECTQRLGICGRGGLCRNTDGGYNCTCTRGYKPEFKDSKICVDINECEKNNGGCQMRCHNLQPGYRCSCNPEWHLNRDGARCSPLRGACPRLKPLINGRILPEAPCVHFGTVLIDRYCLYACNSGYKRLGEDRRKCGPNGWTGKPPTCVPVAWCPILRIPEGVNVMPPACASNTNSPWMICMFSCKVPLHKMTGSRATRCSRTRRWSTQPPTCVPRNETSDGPEAPRIRCPRDMDVDLAPGKAVAKLTLPSPDSNTVVTSQRNDGSTSRNVFPAGTTSVKFTAVSADGERQVSCVMRVRVRDKEAPVIKQCPGSISIESRHKYPKMAWNPPLFNDNVEVENIKESRFPLGNITWGTYSISYTASDAAGNMAECAFSVTITRPKTSMKSLAVSCGKPEGPANGRAECQSWARGVYCIPICNPSFAFERMPPTYMCDEQGVWSPGKVIPDCVDIRSANLKKPAVLTKAPPTTPLTTVTITDVITTTTMLSATERTETPRSTSSQSTAIPKLKILEKPSFHLVSTEETKTPGTQPIVVHSVVPVRVQNNNFVLQRASRPRLIKLTPVENDCSFGHVPEYDENGQVTCVVCARGTYRPRVKSATKCLPCSIGFYQDQPGMGYCKRCPGYIPHASVYSMRGKEKFIGLKSTEECQRIRTAEETNIKDSAVRRALRRRSRLLHHH